MVCKAARNNGSMSAELCKWPLTKHAPGASANACRDGALNDATAVDCSRVMCATASAFISGSDCAALRRKSAISCKTGRLEQVVCPGV